MKTTTLKLKFPFILEFEDYHEIDDFSKKLDEMFNKNTKYFEIIDDEEESLYDWNTCYRGCFYIGKKPTKTETKELMAKFKK